MKIASFALSSARHLFAKVFFLSQIIVITAGLPALYSVGVSHNLPKTDKTIIIKTNKGKRIIKSIDEFKKAPGYSSIETDNVHL